MAFTNPKRHQSGGFTLVELLIVIVVIAILAAITIIAYNGVTQKAKTSQAQSAANSVQQVAELYNNDQGNYPVACLDMRNSSLTTKLPTSITLVTGGTSSATSVTVASPGTSVTGLTATPTTPSTVAYYPTSSNGNAPTTSTVNGGVIWYWDYTINGPTQTPVYVGNAAASSGTVSVWGLTGASSNVCPSS